jgi:hypothetical protein
MSDDSTASRNVVSAFFIRLSQVSQSSGEILCGNPLAGKNYGNPLEIIGQKLMEIPWESFGQNWWKSLGNHWVKIDGNPLEINLKIPTQYLPLKNTQ